MNGLLVRVGIDSADNESKWIAPTRTATREFAYVTIKETKQLRDGMARYYNEFAPIVAKFGRELPKQLHGTPTHLDPDFDCFTYGDQGERGRCIAKLERGDFLAFFASLEPVDAPRRPLVYALIGFYSIENLVSALSVPAARWSENAHTRRLPKEDEIVVWARPGVSGRLRHYLPIGELRNGCYRVKKDLLEMWGGLDVREGYIQRSGHLPAFLDADRFYRWFLDQSPELIAANNPEL